MEGQGAAGKKRGQGEIDPILQMRILRLEEGKSLAQKHKHLEFKNNSVHLYAFGVVGWEVGFWR